MQNTKEIAEIAENRQGEKEEETFVESKDENGFEKIGDRDGIDLVKDTVEKKEEHVNIQADNSAERGKIEGGKEMIHTDPKDVTVGDAVGENIEVADDANLDIQPAVGVEWVIENIYFGDDCIISWYDGTNTIRIADADGPDALQDCCFRVTNTNYIRVHNDSGGASDYGYSGYIKI